MLVPTITDRIDSRVLAQAGPKLKLIASFGTGVDHIDLDSARQRGITVTNTPGVLTDDTADMSMALVLATAHAAASEQDYTESFDTIYNSLTVQRTGTIVELRARSRAGVFRESAVDLADPPTPPVPYIKTVYSGLIFQPKPKKVLMVGLGGAGFVVGTGSGGAARPRWLRSLHSGAYPPSTKRHCSSPRTAQPGVRGSRRTTRRRAACGWRTPISQH